MKNSGKEFEDDFKKSIPADVWYYRFRDSPAGWGGDNEGKTSFATSNICDCELYRSGLYLLELKTHLGKSIPNAKFKVKHLEEMAAAKLYGITAGVIINMRDVEQTYFLDVEDVLSHINESGRASIPIAYMQERGYLVKSEKKKVHYRYDVDDMLKNMGEK